MTELTAEAVRLLVQQQLAQITDMTVHEALSALLVEPVCHGRYWFYDTEGETYPCWSVAEDADSDTLYVYCETGFGPQSPWGIVFISDNVMGADSGWFPSLEQAFYDSFAAGGLPIWELIRRDAPDESRIVAHDISLDDAFALRDRLDAQEGTTDRSSYTIEARTPKGRN